MRHLIPALAVGAVIALGGAVASAQTPTKKIEQTVAEPTYFKLSAKNGFDYFLDESQPLVCYLDEAHSYLRDAADSAVAHCFANTPNGWVELGDPTTVRALGTLSGEPAGTSFFLGKGME